MSQEAYEVTCNKCGFTWDQATEPNESTKCQLCLNPENKRYVITCQDSRHYFRSHTLNATCTICTPKEVPLLTIRTPYQVKENGEVVKLSGPLDLSKIPTFAELQEREKQKEHQLRLTELEVQKQILEELKKKGVS
jgi:hypothetical protein